MAEEDAKSEIPDVDGNQNSVEATIMSDAMGCTESSCNDYNSNVESSTVTSDGEREKLLRQADELMDKGSKAAKGGDYAEAVECYSRALEIRVAHYGELAPECINAYYKYGCALLYKAQEEADPLGAVPKKESESHQDQDKDGSVKSRLSAESSVASVSSKGKADGDSRDRGKAPENEVKDNEEDEEESDTEDLGEGDEDESDLDLAWKMLDVARAIVEKQAEETMERVDILSALAEVALEREDIETSLSDYLKALSILERLVELDSRHIAELNFRISLCLEIGSKPDEAVPYCQKAISVCKSRLQRLTDEIQSVSGSKATAAQSDQSIQQSSSTSQSCHPDADKEAEIKVLSGLSGELEKKLEDLQQLVLNPKSIISDILGMIAAKSRDQEKSAASAALSSSQLGAASSGGDFDSSTVSTAHTNGAAGVTNLGVVGRGVKRVVINSTATETGPTKRPSIESSPKNGDSGSS